MNGEWEAHLLDEPFTIDVAIIQITDAQKPPGRTESYVTVKYFIPEEGLLPQIQVHIHGTQEACEFHQPSHIYKYIYVQR